MAKIDGVDEGGEAEGAGGREESDEWEEFGNRKVVRKHDPRQPSQQEKEEHEMTHLPFRSWCRHCIMGRGREEDCRKSMEEERQVPEVHLDSMFMGDEKEGKTLAFLVARERETRAVLSTVVPVGSSKSNGIVERAIQSVQGMIRTIRSDIEGRWGVKIDATHSIWPWIAEHAGFLLMRFEVGRDGKTAYERLKGKSAKVQGMAFAEGILWKRKRAGGPLGKLTCMWEDGIYLGVKATTAEVIVGNRNGVWLTRVVAVPWRKNEDDPKMDGERLKSEVIVMDKEFKEKLEAE